MIGGLQQQPQPVLYPVFRPPSNTQDRGSCHRNRRHGTRTILFQKRPTGYHCDYPHYLLVEYSLKTSPTLQETLNAVKQWAQTDGVTGINATTPDEDIKRI